MDKNRSEIISKQADRYCESYATRPEEVQIAVKQAYINGAKFVLFHYVDD